MRTVQPRQLNGDFVVPSSLVSDWVEVNVAPVTADNGGSAVVNPATAYAAARHRVLASEGGTLLDLCLAYFSDCTGITDPVVQVFGGDRNGVWRRLFNADGDHELTLVTAATDVVGQSVTDSQDQDSNYVPFGSYKFTDPIEIDMCGLPRILVCVKTAFAASGGTPANSRILAHIK